MIPIRDVIPSPALPAATIGLMTVQVAMWCAQILFPPGPANLLASITLHTSWLHLVGNVWGLWLFGDNLEGRLGRGPFLVFYLACGVVAVLIEEALASPVASATSISGSSGALAGVMGAYLALYPQSRVLTFVPLVATWDLVEVPAGWLLAAWASLQLLTTGALSGPAAGSGPALAAVAGTFLLGAAAGLVFRRTRDFPAW